jgi:PAS domain S-box-containing protein
MKLTPKLALIFISFAILLVLGVGMLAYNSGRAALEAATFAELESTSVEKSAAIDNWVAEHKSDITALSHSPALLEALETFLGSSPTTNSEREQLVRELSVRTGPDQPYLTLLILSPETGEILIATDPSEEGKFKEDRPYFIEGKSAPFVSTVYYSLVLQRPAITASAPLRREDGKLLGVLAGRLNLEELNTIIQRRSGLRQTDDAFLVNTSNLFVTQPYLLPDPAVLQRGIHTEAVRQCLATRSRGTLSTLDYRNVPAIITYRWLPAHEMCLIVKMNRAEALAPVHDFGRAILWIALATLIVASGLAFVLARSMIRPILAMQTTAQGYGRGELDVRLPDTRRDELGVLAHEVNQMAAALAQKEMELRSHAQTLEQKVQERTRELQEAHAQLSNAEQVGQIGSWVWYVPENRVVSSEGLHRLLGLTAQELGNSFETYFALIHPDDIEQMQQIVQNALQKNGPFEMETRAVLKDGQVRTLYSRGETLLDEEGHPLRQTGVVVDITERKRAEAELEHTLEELKHSNAELEQFAYVASHDLQEPLRMVSSYMQLLKRRYQGKLDKDADEFIAFAVDGATRMQNLINDLLAFSRVGTRGRPMGLSSCEKVLAEALINLQVAVEESKAIITHDPLPTVFCDQPQLVQVFQNLLVNSIKFRGQQTPQIHISAKQEDSEWLFSVCDNGIGLDSKFGERIFEIFQRLHSRTAYPGTGIGLAICKRIVQRHGGRIWVESQPGQGATFYFTIPIKENL